MARKIFRPRKQRTREHVIADLSVHHVEGFILEQGYAAQRLGPDYGYDLILFTFDEQGYFEPGWVYLQLKAAEALETVRADYVFDLDVRDYNLWASEKVPVILILFDVSHRRAYWLHVQSYFSEDVSRQPKKGAKTVRVRVPPRRRVSRRAVAAWRELKGQAGHPATGAEP